MFKITVAKLSSTGHIVIPKDACKRLHLRAGAQFIVVGRGDLGLVKSVSPQTLALVENLVDSLNGLLQRLGMGHLPRPGGRGAKRRRPSATAAYQ